MMANLCVVVSCSFIIPSLTQEPWQTWPVCHVLDNTTLYIDLLRKIVVGETPGYGKNGYYLAASGSVAWDDIYSAMAKGLAKRKAVSDDSVVRADSETIEKMGTALGCPPEMVAVQIGGLYVLP